MLAIHNKRNARRLRSTNSLRRKRQTDHDDAAQKALKRRREKRRAGRKDATRASGARIEACSLDAQETSAAVVFPADRGAKELPVSKEPAKLTRLKTTVEFPLRILAWIEEGPAVETLVQSLAAEFGLKMEVNTRSNTLKTILPRKREKHALYFYVCTCMHLVVSLVGFSAASEILSVSD